MHEARARLRSALRREPPDADAAGDDAQRDQDARHCSWDALRAVYEEQAERGVPEAIRGLELIEQDRWPSSGRPRKA